MIKACKKCRREGEKLMLKGERCFGTKCAMTKRPYVPGQHGPNQRVKISEYGRQLREKQKVKRIYGLSESDLKRIYVEADRLSGNTAENLIKLIESRLDNAVYRTGICDSRSSARQITSHKHVFIDDSKVSIPSIRIKIGQKLSFDKTITSEFKKLKPAAWIKLDDKTHKFEYLRLPSREELDFNVNESLVVEYYSR